MWTVLTWEVVPIFSSQGRYHLNKNPKVRCVYLDDEGLHLVVQGIRPVKPQHCMGRERS